ncbi:CASP-like protein 4A1 [Phragmites australis]|uniref:CASP-like protein 4A1 n=1 Tax=Phragmites australis TaxID=29695 RepID=UPI002D7899EC|nr:CASP-like protein 4A1 [Phragmites australis]
MKTLCSKPGKGGKIHPSPSGAGGWGDDPVAAAFRLLPAAMLVVATALRPEDQEVLAHLVIRKPLQGGDDAAAVPPSEQPARGVGRRHRGHPPTIGCGCFECYITFWSRWDCSPQCDGIHAALDAFEEHLFAAEAAATPPPSSKRRDKGKRSRVPAIPPPPPPPQPPMPLRRPKSLEPQAVEVVQELSSPLAPSCPPPPPLGLAAYIPEEKDKAPQPSAEAEVGERESTAEERKRGWVDVMGGVLGLRLWGIWSPVVESAT